MKNKKVIIYSIILLLLISCVGLGAASLIMADNYKNNNVTFEVEDDMAYSKIEGKYYYNNQEQTAKAYGPEYYTQSSDLDIQAFNGFKTWNIGDSTFNPEYDGVETFKYEITITNLNTEKALEITLADVAIGNKTENNVTVLCFYTKISYFIGEGTEQVQFNNKEGEEVNLNYYSEGQTSVDINVASQVAVNSKIKIVVELERKTKTESFTILNNFKVNLQTAS